MMKQFAIALALTTACALPAFADDTVQELASPEEAAMVQEAIAKVGCTAEKIEKERDDLYEIDDAQCEIGQYDIKLDGDYQITVMTRD